MLDVHAGDVIRQQHDLVAVQLFSYLYGRLLVSDLLITRVIKFRSNKRVKDVDALIAKARPNSYFRTSSTLRTMKSTIGCGV